MEEFLQLKEFISSYGDLPETGFRTRFDHPFLLANFTREDRREPGRLYHQKTQHDTVDVSEETHDSGMTTLVIPVAKSERCPDEKSITLGRSPENDLIIVHPCISRRHAVFKEDLDTRGYTLLDVGSSYGTVVAGQTLEPDEATSLASGTSVIFGKTANCTFLFSHDFYKYVQLLEDLRNRDVQ
jgi:hypothetical protein